MVPLVKVTVWPDVIDTLLRMISVALVPTVRPETITVPALFRISARAAVPVADAVAESGTPEMVRMVLDTIVAGVALSVIVARTPVAPDSAEVPMTNVPADAVPEPTT